jgi:DNA (cytosine-5)-methyltransferase 1
VTRPYLIDVFSGGGGAARGYQRAGFHVLGIDSRPIRGYAGDLFVQADWEDGLWDVWQMVRSTGVPYAIHASPPCQSYSTSVVSDGRWDRTAGRHEPRLIGAVRSRLQETGAPWVIENVVGARDELRGPLMLCGTMFGLVIARHRLFETSWRIGAFDTPRHPVCTADAKAHAIARGWDPRDMAITGKGRRAGTGDRWREVMGIDWPMTQHNVREAIPPAYGEWMGHQLAAQLRRGQ